MNTISPPQLINRGILISFPPTIRGALSVDIYFSDKNPKYNWLICNVKTKLLWRITSPTDPLGTVINYTTVAQLNPGFYTVKASIITSNRVLKGSTTIGLLTAQDNLLIGFPYSAYPSIVLT